MVDACDIGCIIVFETVKTLFVKGHVAAEVAQDL